MTWRRFAFWVSAPSLEEHECKQTDGGNEEKTDGKRDWEDEQKEKETKEMKIKQGPTVTNSN